MRNLKFLPENYYHIYNRGVDKRKIFMEKDDRIRFLLGLLVFNSSKNFLISKWFNALGQGKDPIKYIEEDLINPPVGISAFCLMPNHFHLALTPLREGGVSSFMKDLSCGYTNYFNEKYDRTGSLFEGPFKAKCVSDENYFTGLIRYIHLNPLDTKTKKWRKRGIKNKKKLLSFLKSYQWSSLPFYLGQNKIKIINRILDPSMVKNYFPGPEDHLKSLNFWSEEDYEDLESIRFEDVVKNKKSY